MSHRVRTIIRYLNYGLVRSKLPKKALFTGIKRGGNMPSLARKIGYPQFGMFLDWFIRKVLASMYELEYLDSERKVSSDITSHKLYTWCSVYYFEQKPISKEAFSTDKKYYKNIKEYIGREFTECKSIEFEPEWTCILSKYNLSISGHPDLIIDNTIYDIKTTGQFNLMRTSTIFQLLAYFCLAKKLDLPITHIGLILPAQEKVITADLSKWDWKPFWKELKNALQVKISLTPSDKLLCEYQLLISEHVGSHIKKDVTVSRTLEGVSKSLPWQIFLSGNTRADFNITDNDIAKTRALTERGYRFYVHSPYTLNLSRTYDDNWVVECLRKHLRTCVAMGCKGLVIHCGVKAKTVDYDTAYQNMYYSVIQAAEVATPDCPLLIETSAKETGELLPEPEGIIGFYHSLPDEIRVNVKICVDTCHVFSAGYLPQDFINELEESNVPIGLIHFNDSQECKGCCKDRHAPIGTGHVGLHNLIKVGKWAIKNKIDLVYE